MHNQQTKIVLRSNTGSRVLNVLVAATKEQHRKGLRGVNSVPNDGMLFEYSYPSQAPFWMEGVFIPLTIAFFDVRGHMIDWFEMESQSHSSCQPSRPYRMVLEVPRGSVEFSQETQLRRNLTRYAYESTLLSDSKVETLDER